MDRQATATKIASWLRRMDARPAGQTLATELGEPAIETPRRLLLRDGGAQAVASILADQGHISFGS